MLALATCASVSLAVWRVNNITQLMQDIIEDVCSSEELTLREGSLPTNKRVGRACSRGELSDTNVISPHTSEDVLTSVVLVHDEQVPHEIKLCFVREHHASAWVHDALPYFV